MQSKNLPSLKELKKSFIVLDYNPDLIHRLRKRKIPCLYGDLADKEILERLNFDSAQLIISTVPEFNYNHQLLKHAKDKKKDTVVFITASSVHDAMELYNEGADYVILPHFLGADRVAMILEDISTDIGKIIKNRFEHVNELKKRIRMGHVHPHKHGHYKH